MNNTNMVSLQSKALTNTPANGLAEHISTATSPPRAMDTDHNNSNITDSVQRPMDTDDVDDTPSEHRQLVAAFRSFLQVTPSVPLIQFVIFSSGTQGDSLKKLAYPRDRLAHSLNFL